MKNYKYTILELEVALSDVEKDSGDFLFNIINKVFNGYDKSTFHKMYIDECNENLDRSQLENYLQFKLKLLNMFFDSADKRSPAFEMFFIGEKNRPFIQLEKELDDFYPNKGTDQFILDKLNVPTLKPNRLSIILDYIVQYILYHSDSTFISLLEILEKYKEIIKDNYSKILNNALNSLGISVRLDDKQVALLKKYDAINPSKWIQVDINDNNKISLANDPNYQMYTRDINDDTLLQMYLLGKPSVLPISYRYTTNRTTDKVESQKAYDDFVRLLWKFGQSKKPNHRDVPKQVRLLCLELLNIVAEASPGTKYDKQTDFPLNDISTAWRNFGTFNTNIKTHKYRKKPTN